MANTIAKLDEAETQPFAVDLLLSAVNIADNLDEAKLNRIGMQVVQGFDMDRESRSDWEKRYEGSLKLAAQVVEKKSFPWPDAANIKYPLLTTACIQFSARSYPALVPGKDLVLTKVTGADPDGFKAGAASRISQHMSYQILEQMEEWEEDMDRMLVMLPCTGTEFKKTYYDPIKGRNVSEHVLARDLVVNYWAKSLETATRKTHVLFLSPNEIRERVLKGIFLDQNLKYSSAMPDPLKTTADAIQGMSPPPNDEDTPFEILECHTWLDLDDDGYKEPYIVTVARETQKVLRISARFDRDKVETDNKGKILRIEPVEYFTKFSFIPSLDGGFYDLGWGHLLGPINETVNTTINQLLDAGTLSNMQAGFLSRGIRIRGGESRFKPGEWKFVDSTGDDLRKGIVPLPVRDPSNVLFQLLGTMTQAGERLSNVVDILVGENPGQNQPATTTMAVIEQGLKVFTAIYKRLYRSLKLEYRKLYRLNRLYLPDMDYFRVLDPDKNVLQMIRRSDYHGDPTDVQPASDPNMISESQRLVRAQALVTSMQNGSPANPLEVWKRYYEAMRIDNIETLLPAEMPPPPPDPKMIAIQMDDKHKEMEHQFEQVRLQIEQSRVALEEAKLQLETQRIAFEQEMERYKADRESVPDDNSSTLEILKMDLERERMNHEKELARLKEESQKEIEKLKLEHADRQASADREFQIATKEAEDEKEEEKTETTEAVKTILEYLTKPKSIVFDKDGNPVGIKTIGVTASKAVKPMEEKKGSEVKTMASDLAKPKKIYTDKDGNPVKIGPESDK